MIESILSTHQFNGDDEAALRSAVHVDASAIAALFFSYEPEHWSVSDFDEIIPPYPNLWIEFEAPQTVALYGGEIVKWPYDKAASMWGAMVRTYEAKLSEFVGGFDNLLIHKGNVEEGSAADVELTKWCTVVDIYGKLSGHDPTHCFRGTFAVSEDGRPVMIPSGTAEDPRPHWISVTPPGDDFERERHLIIAMTFLAISFMHFRNVSLINRPVNEREARLFVKKHGRPMMQFKTLVIDHMKRILRNSEHGSGKSLKRAFHEVRGHIVRYSEERPLFGKYPGRFWVPSHVRGDATMGIVKKNYLVR